MNEAWLFLIVPVGYLFGMVVTAFVLGWCFKNSRDHYDDIPATFGVIFWPIALPIGIVIGIFWPFFRLVYDTILGAYELGKGQSDLHVGARTKKIFGRVGR